LRYVNEWSTVKWYLVIVSVGTIKEVEGNDGMGMD